MMTVRIMLILFVLGAVASCVAFPFVLVYSVGETVDQRSE